MVGCLDFAGPVVGLEVFLSGFGNVLEKLLFVFGISFDGIDEVGDEIEPALQGGVDIRPGLSAACSRLTALL